MSSFRQERTSSQDRGLMVLGCARHMGSNHNESASREITQEAHEKSRVILWLSAFRSVWSPRVPRTPRSGAASLIPRHHDVVFYSASYTAHAHNSFCGISNSKVVPKKNSPTAAARAGRLSAFPRSLPGSVCTHALQSLS